MHRPSPPPSRAALLLLVGLLVPACRCGPEVVITTDGGADAGPDSDAGFDAGVPDGGPSDGGGGDAGSASCNPLDFFELPSPGATSCPFCPPEVLAAAPSPTFVVLADLDGDGRADLVVPSYFQSPVVAVLLALADGGFAPARSYATGPSGANGSLGAAVGELTGEGAPDLVVANTDQNTLTLFRGAGGGAFDAGVALGAWFNPRAVAMADFNLDGRLDLVAPVNIAGVGLALGLGGGTFTAPVVTPTGNAPEGLGVGDFDLDGRPDVVVANSYSNTLSLLLGQADGGLGAAQNFAVGQKPIAVTVADLDGDGRLDVATSNQVSNDVTVLYGLDGGSLGRARTLATSPGPVFVVAGDVLEDARPDLVVLYFGQSHFSVFPGRSDAGFGPRVDCGRSGWDSIAAAIGDLDHVGQSDLALANYSAGTVSVLKR